MVQFFETWLLWGSVVSNEQEADKHQMRASTIQLTSVASRKSVLLLGVVGIGNGSWFRRRLTFRLKPVIDKYLLKYRCCSCFSSIVLAVSRFRQFTFFFFVSFLISFVRSFPTVDLYPISSLEFGFPVFEDISVFVRCMDREHAKVQTDFVQLFVGFVEKRETWDRSM